MVGLAVAQEGLEGSSGDQRMKAVNEPHAVGYGSAGAAKAITAGPHNVSQLNNMHRTSWRSVKAGAEAAMQLI